jgi:hypothetical protein
MDRTDTSSEKPARTVRNWKQKRIGFVGKGVLTPKETGIIWYIGRCIAKLGHTVIIAKAQGATGALRDGVEREGGSLETVTSGIIEASDHTWIYPDPQLTAKMKMKYPDLLERDDVIIITEEQLDEWYESVRTVLLERNVALPT